MSKDKMTTTPWVAGGSFPYKGNEGYIFATSMRPEILVCKTFGLIDENTPPLGEQMENSKAIVSAVNNTYGVGINPQAVLGLLDSLNRVLLGWAPLNESYVVIPKIEIEIIKATIEKAKL